MKKEIARLIGVFVLIVGIIDVYNITISVIYSPSSVSINIIGEIVISWIALYGGYETIKLKFIGGKLLLVFFSYQVVQTSVLILFAIFTVALGPSYNLSFKPYAPQLILLNTSVIAFYIVALIFLLKKDTSSYFQTEQNHHHIEVLGKILSLITPGLGRALVGNHWVGIILFDMYFLLFTGLHIFTVSQGSDLTIAGKVVASSTFWNSFFDFLVKLLIWISFFRIDWIFVKNAAKIQEDISQPTERTSSLQNSG